MAEDASETVIAPGTDPQGSYGLLDDVLHRLAEKRLDAHEAMAAAVAAQLQLKELEERRRRGLIGGVVYREIRRCFPPSERDASDAFPDRASLYNMRDALDHLSKILAEMSKPDSAEWDWLRIRDNTAQMDEHLSRAVNESTEAVADRALDVFHELRLPRWMYVITFALPDATEDDERQVLERVGKHLLVARNGKSPEAEPFLKTRADGWAGDIEKTSEGVPMWLRAAAHFRKAFSEVAEIIPSYPRRKQVYVRLVGIVLLVGGLVALLLSTFLV